MVIQYTPNAAAISWLALSQSLDSRAFMEGALFKLSASNTCMSITETKTQAASAQRAGEDRAEQARIQGITAMVGAGASALATGVCMGVTSSYKDQASTPTEQTEMSIQAKSTNLNETELSTFKDTSGSAEITTGTNNNTSGAPSTTTTSGAPSTQITARNSSPAAPSTTDSANKPAKSQDNQADDNAARQKAYQRKMDMIAQNSSTFSQMANQVFGTGLSNLWQTGCGIRPNYILDQGKAEAAQALAQGLSAVFSSQSSQLAAALSSCDSYMQNTNGTIATLIQTSAVRG